MRFPIAPPLRHPPNHKPPQQHLSTNDDNAKHIALVYDSRHHHNKPSLSLRHVPPPSSHHSSPYLLHTPHTVSILHLIISHLSYLLKKLIPPPAGLVASPTTADAANRDDPGDDLNDASPPVGLTPEPRDDRAVLPGDNDELRDRKKRPMTEDLTPPPPSPSTICIGPTRCHLPSGIKNGHG
jgi:hypothetical protein